MAIIIDRRNTKSSKNMSNRERFVKRFKRRMKKSLDDIMQRKSIKDASGPVDVPVDWSIQEQNIDFDHETGESEVVISGNERFQKGDLIDKPDKDGNTGGNGGESGEDHFMFTLTKEEFFDLYFDDLDLPDFVKESMLDTTKNQYKRAGYIKDGIPARLDVLKTLQMAIARRISCSKTANKPPFLDDVDLRYKHYKNVPQPMLKAVMFCCMDVSGSMEEHHKFLSKKFFILLYLFLTKNYEAVEIRFIKYHHFAFDTDEQDFFYSADTGGTSVLEGLRLINKIIDEEYPTHIYNIYIAHTSDGDMDYDDRDNLIPFLDNELLQKVQYYAYIQVQTPYQYATFKKGQQKMYGLLQQSQNIGKKLNTEFALQGEDMFPVLHNLFKRGEK